jgi:NAD+ synthase (glutamine-hydrolysing)
MLKIAGATVNQIPLQWSHNTGNILSAIRAAQQEQVQLLCFPELCISGYGCEDMFLSDWLPARAWQELLTIIPHCQHLTVCVGLPVRFDGITYNGVAVIDNGKLLGITLKQNLARDGVHYEPRWFDPWEQGKITERSYHNSTVLFGDIIYTLHGVRVGFEICEDAWRKDRPGYALCERGVQLMLNPSASHFALGKSVTREALVKDSSSQFGCVYLYVNLLGNEAGRMIYDGDIIVAQQGELLALNNRLSFQSWNLLTCSIDVDTPANSERKPLHDNKEKNEEFAQAVTLALYDYLRKSKAKGFVLSLSGGADSSICAVLVAEMIRRGVRTLGLPAFAASLGLPENTSEKTLASILLTCAYQASRNSSVDTLHAAQSLAESIQATFYHWSIQDEVDSYTRKIETAMQRSLSWETDDITLQNIQARARSPIIWMLANSKQALLLTTSNRSEGDVGYATMDGDTSGSLAPIAGIGKTFILQWLQWAEQTLGYTGLRAVNNLEPTAELRPAERHQTDETDLMPYALLQAIEHLAIFERRPPVEVFQMLKKSHPDLNSLKRYITRFFRLWSINQWKRERIAPSFHLDDLNVDPRTWCRFPILSSGFREELEALEQLD